MISSEFAGTQIKRLAGLLSFPREALAIQELIKALIASFPTEGQAERFVDLWLRERHECPRPLHIYEQRERPREKLEETIEEAADREESILHDLKRRGLCPEFIKSPARQFLNRLERQALLTPKQ